MREEMNEKMPNLTLVILNGFGDTFTNEEPEKVIKHYGIFS
jgi:hypothetical protein